MEDQQLNKSQLDILSKSNYQLQNNIQISNLCMQKGPKLEYMFKHYIKDKVKRESLANSFPLGNKNILELLHLKQYLQGMVNNLMILLNCKFQLSKVSNLQNLDLNNILHYNLCITLPLH